MPRTSPGIPLRRLKADVWWVGKRRVDAVQMPVRVTKVALEHLALISARHATLGTQDDFMLGINSFCVFRLLVAIATILRAVEMLVPDHATKRVTLTVETS